MSTFGRLSADDGFVVGEAVELGFPRIHLLLGEPEVVTDLVQQSELDLVDEFGAVDAVIEQGLAIQKDDIGQHVAVPTAPFVEGHPGVEPVEGVAPGIETQLVQGLVVGPVLDLDGDVTQEFGKLVRETVEGVGNYLFKGLSVDGEARASGAGAVGTAYL